MELPEQIQIYLGLVSVGVVVLLMTDTIDSLLKSVQKKVRLYFVKRQYLARLKAKPTKVVTAKKDPDAPKQ